MFAFLCYVHLSVYFVLFYKSLFTDSVLYFLFCNKPVDHTIGLLPRHMLQIIQYGRFLYKQRSVQILKLTM